MTNKDGQSIKDIAATLRGDPSQPSPKGQPTKAKRPGSQSLSNTRPALTRSRVKAGRAVKVVDPTVPKAATLLRYRPQNRATNTKGQSPVSNLFDFRNNTGRSDASGVGIKLFSSPDSPKTLPLGKTSSSLFSEVSGFSPGVSLGGEDQNCVLPFLTLARSCQRFVVI